MDIQVTKETLAVVHAASNSETRYALNGVHIDGEKGNAVATDGRILAVATLPKAMELPETIAQDSERESGIVPLETVKEMRKVRPTAGIASRSPQACRGSVSFNGQGQFRGFKGKDLSVQSLEFRELEGKFPDYESVIPQDKPAMVLGLCASDLERLCKVAREFAGADDGEIIRLEMRDPLKAVVMRQRKPSTGQELTAIIMPVHIQENRGSYSTSD